MNVLSILEGIISSVPEAVQLYHKIAPLISTRADIPQEHIDEIEALVPVAHDTVQTAHTALSTLLDAHAGQTD